MAASLKSTAANVDSLTGKMSRGDGSLGAFVNDRTLFDLSYLKRSGLK